MKIEPLGDYVLLQVEPEEERKTGILYIAGDTMYREGVIQDIGPSEFNESEGLKIGDRVLFPKKISKFYRPVEVLIEGDTFLLIRPEYLIGRIIKEPVDAIA